MWFNYLLDFYNSLLFWIFLEDLSVNRLEFTLQIRWNHELNDSDFNLFYFALKKLHVLVDVSKLQLSHLDEDWIFIVMFREIDFEFKEAWRSCNGDACE